MNVENFKQTFLPLSNKLFNTAYRMLGTTQDAEDVVQEVFLKLWQKRNIIPLDGNLTNFCITLTRNLCVDYMRRQHLKVVDDEPSETDIVQEKNIEDELTDQEEHRCLITAINQLPSSQRKVMLMRDIEGMNYSEIADAIGWSEVHVRVTLSRARKAIKTIFKKQ